MTRDEIKNWLKSLGDVADCKKTTDEVLKLIEADEMAIKAMADFIAAVRETMNVGVESVGEGMEELGIGKPVKWK